MAVIRAARSPQVKSPALLSPQQRNLAGACLAHFLHDGYTDQLYALLPIWQAQFGLSYAGLAVLRALYYGTMGGLQVPGNRLIAKAGPRAALAVATFIAASGYLLMALPGGLIGLCIGLVVAGIGSSVQHPRASLLVTDTYGRASRGPLGIYNFSGDLGKALFPAIVALLLTVSAWRPVVGLTAVVVGLAVALGLLWLVPRQPFTAPAAEKPAAKRAMVRVSACCWPLARSIQPRAWAICCSCRSSSIQRAARRRRSASVWRCYSSAVHLAKPRAVGSANIWASYGP